MMLLKQALEIGPYPVDTYLAFIGFGIVFPLLLYMAYKTKNLEFWQGTKAIAIFLSILALSFIPVDLSVYGLVGQAIWWITHIAAITFLIPYLVSALIINGIAYVGGGIRTFLSSLR